MIDTRKQFQLQTGVFLKRPDVVTFDVSLIKSRVMIIDVLQNCKMIIIAQVFSIKSPNILLHALRKRRKKRVKDKKTEKKNEKKIGMNINEKNIRLFAQLNILHISRAIRSFIRPCDCPTSIDWFTATSHTRRVVIKNVLSKNC